MQAIECIAATKFFYEKEKNNKSAFQGIRAKLKWKKSRKKITAVNSVTFEVPKGEIFGIVGPNGSGKSTLIRMLSTLVLPDAGNLRIFGIDVVKESMRVRKNINRVSVDAAFFKKLSAWENLSYAARLYGLNPREAKESVVKILERMNFKEDRMYQPLENMSRGMQQKVAIARALFTSPMLLLMDEPTTGLDPVSKRQVQEFILKIREDHDTTVLLTSHDMDEVERICDRVAIISNGQFIVCDTPKNLKENSSTDSKNKTLEDVFFELTGKSLLQDF